MAGHFLQLDLFRRGDGAITSALADLNFKASEIAHLAPRLKGRPKFLFWVSRPSIALG